MNTPTALRKDSMMTRAQGSLRMIWLGLISCLAMVLAGCSMPRNDFDVRDETQLIGDEPDFLSLDLARPLPPETLRPPQAPYRVGPGDTLDIEVAEDANTRAASKVMPDGMLYFDVADGIKVSGKTLKEVSDALAASLAKDYPSPVVTVNLADAQSQRFFILGQVKTPGAYPIVLGTYTVVCSKYPDSQVAPAVKAFLTIALGKGQEGLTDNGYIPVPDSFKGKLSAAIDAIA